MIDRLAAATPALRASSLRLARNSAWNLVALFATVAVHFVTVPIVINRMGLGEFGNAGLVLALWAPLLLVGTVVGQALTRELGVRAANHAGEESRRLTESASLLWLVSTIAGWLLLVLLGPGLLWHFAGTSSTRTEWRWELALAGIGWAAQQGSLMLQGASVAYQNYRVVAWVTVVTAIATIAAILWITASVPDAGGYLAGLAAGFVFGLLLWLAVARLSGSARHFMPRLHRAELHCLVSFGKWQGMAHLAGTIANQIDRYVLGAVISPVIVGQYNAAKRPQEAAYSVASKFAEVLFPYFAATSRSDAAQQARLYLLASWVVMTCGAVVLGPAIPLADPIMQLWVGPEVAHGGAQLMRTLMLGGLLGCGSNVFALYLMGIGRNAAYGLISVLYSCLTIVLTIIVIRRWGGYAAGVGLVVAGAVRVLVSLGLLRHRFLRNIRMRDLVTSSIAPLVIGGGFAYLWRLVPGIVTIHTWSGVVLAYVAVALSIGAGVWLVSVLSAFGREAIASVAGLLRNSLPFRKVA